MVFSDLHLARRLEAAEAANARGCTAIHPEAATLEVAGGCAVFVGAESPLSHAVGIGLDGPVTEAGDRPAGGVLPQPRRQGLDRTLPAGRPGLLAMLGDRGYRRHGIQQRAGETAGRALGIVLTPRVRRALPDETDLWSHTVGRGFFEEHELTTEEMDVGRAICAMPGALCYLAVTESGDTGRRRRRGDPRRAGDAVCRQHDRRVTAAADCTAN